MNRKSLALLVALAAAAGPSFAESYTEHNTPFVSTAARATVAAQVAQPQQGVSPWSIRYDPLAGFRSTTSRAEVTAEYLADRDLVSALNGEDSGSSYLAGAAAGSRRARFAGQPAAAH